ncbi:MAG: D-cysteine desulfhydrase family protein, partial [Chloroflexi bacterium]|nr:D-cysteine desulfhydrase family protein [Chloroflexota bacterium]
MTKAKSPSQIPRVPLGHLPTPLEDMPRLAQHLGGPRLLIKRDDQTGLAFGGNKTRKLEYFLAEALAQGADTLVTLGVAHSNHVRQTAAAAAKLGLKAVLLLRGPQPEGVTGNILLDQLLGAELRWLPPGNYPLTNEVAKETLAELRRAGRKPYLVPYGGTNELGIIGYVAAMEEILGQLRDKGLKAEHMVMAASSGGTQTGLVLGKKLFGYDGEIIGISVALPKQQLIADMLSLAQRTIARWGFEITVLADDFLVYDDYLGAGYGVSGPPEVEAIRLVAQREGILLDPVYTGRAMAGLIDLIRRGTFHQDETIVFWHTGGTPSLFTYAQELGVKNSGLI